jgi:hypothetical protein
MRAGACSCKKVVPRVLLQRVQHRELFLQHANQTNLQLGSKIVETLEKAHASREIKETFGANTLNMLVKPLQHLK